MKRTGNFRMPYDPMEHEATVPRTAADWRALRKENERKGKKTAKKQRAQENRDKQEAIAAKLLAEQAKGPPKKAAKRKPTKRGKK